MTIQTDYHGEVSYEPEDLIIVPNGLLGFRHLTLYLPLIVEEGDESLLLLQSTEQPSVVFAVINPIYLVPDYCPVLTPEELSFLEVSDSGSLCYYAVCSIHDNHLDNTVNLKCPLAINPDTHTSVQVILDGTEYGYRHKLTSFLSSQETEHTQNRSDCHVDSQT